MKPLRRFALATVVLLVLHALVHRWMSEGNVVTALFSAGGGSWKGIALACAFLGMRITVIILLPGMIVWRLWDAWWGRMADDG